jgi:3'-phosphoadenosine 5'-phosphosulfate sulfotransferase (PAPS reductase)/FAD synthetase
MISGSSDKEGSMNLLDYSAIVINISGGKDSQTIMGVVMAEVKKQAYSGDVLAIHADTKAEWPQSLPHCQLLCEHYRLQLIVAEPFRPLPEHIERRCIMMAAQQPRGKPGWPSPAQRYCTSDCKRAPIEKAVRASFPAKLGKSILTVTGERRQESAHRAKLSEVEPDKTLTAGYRSVTKWRPILDYTEEHVWSHIRATGIPRHIAYDLGNKRLSCAMCIMACEQDIRNGANARPDLAEMFLRIERETGFSFMHKKSLETILSRGGDHADMGKNF